MSDNSLKNILECLLFVSSKPLDIDTLSDIIEQEKEAVEKALEELKMNYNSKNKPIFIQQVGGGIRFATRKKYGEYVKKLFRGQLNYKLSNAALETLAIIAYRQPVTSQEIDSIRGVSSSGVIRGLLQKRLVKISGRKETIGRPVLYRTSEKFLEYFGLQSLSDIPPLEELGIEEEVDNLVNDRAEK